MITFNDVLELANEWGLDTEEIKAEHAASQASLEDLYESVFKAIHGND